MVVSVNIVMNIDFNRKDVCYIFGFLWADCFFGASKRGYYSMSFEIKSDDFNSVWGICQDVFGVLKRTTRTRSNSSNSQSCFRIYKQSDCEVFKQFGFHKKNEGCPLYFSIPDENKKFFIKGFLDGDGSISLDKNGLFRVGFNGNIAQSWDFLEDFLSVNNLDFNIYRKERKSNHKSHKKKVHGYSVVEIIKIEQKLKFCSLMNSVDLGLTRKVEVYERYLKIRKEKGLNTFDS